MSSLVLFLGIVAMVSGVWNFMVCRNKYYVEVVDQTTIAIFMALSLKPIIESGSHQVVKSIIWVVVMLCIAGVVYYFKIRSISLTCGYHKLIQELNALPELKEAQTIDLDKGKTYVVDETTRIRVMQAPFKTCKLSFVIGHDMKRLKEMRALLMPTLIACDKRYYNFTEAAWMFLMGGVLIGVHLVFKI